MNKINKLLTLIVLFSSPVLALESDRYQKVHVGSETTKAFGKQNKISYIGDVVVTQGSIKLTADKLDALNQGEEFVATGNPATFYQLMDDGKPINAKANEIRFLQKENMIVLTGNAEVKQLDSQVNGHIITYHIETEEIDAKGKNSQDRVRSVFLPAQFEKDKKSSEKAEK